MLFGLFFRILALFRSLFSRAATVAKEKMGLHRLRKNSKRREAGVSTPA